MELPEFDAPPTDPLPLFVQWFATAHALGVPDPLEVALATVDDDGRASNRMVLLKRVDERGLTFTTTASSRKGRELERNPRGAMVAYWRETTQQLRFEGTVRRLSAEESDALFAVRAIASQASAIASRQSETLDDPSDLAARAAALAASATPLPRSAAWFGYRLEPDTIEFWHGTPHRLHRRLLYERGTEGWTHRRLNP